MSLTTLFTKLTLAGAAVAALATTALPASAATVYGNERADQRYISHQSADGRLSPWERRRLEQRLAAINAERRFDLARNDGRLTPREREHLDAQLRAERFATARDARFHR